MRRASSASSTKSLSTPVVARHYSSPQVTVSQKMLYPRAQAALNKLRQLPQFGSYEEIASQPVSSLPPHLAYSLDVVPSETELDPVSLIRRLLRLGAPLTLVYNAVVENYKPETKLEVLDVEDALDVKQVKRAIYRFCESCVQELGLKLETDLFTISQIFNDSIGELLNPLSTLELLLARLDPDSSSNISPKSLNATPPQQGSALTGPPLQPIQNGVFLNGFAPNGSTPNGSTPNGSTLNGSTLNGPTPNGSALNGSALNGSALNGLAPNESVSLGRSVSNGSTINGATVNGSTLDVGSQNGSLQNGPLPLSPVTPSGPVDELLFTERKYVEGLENLLYYHDEMLASGISRDTVAKLCPGLPKLVEFQRKFLVGCEYQAQEFSRSEQNFGWLFLHMRAGFEIYKMYTLGQQDATRTAEENVAALAPLSHILEPHVELHAAIFSPVQRILRYPMLLEKIMKATPPEWPHYGELQLALDAMNEMMVDVNEAKRRADNKVETRKLQMSVRDWKGLDLSTMGELMLHGEFPVTSMGESEQMYSLYLFERVLLCCRDKVTAKKTPLTKIRPSANSASSSYRNSQGKSMSLELKGRIYLGYVTTLNSSKLPVGGFVLRLGWGLRNDASEHGGFDIRLPNEEKLQQWESTIHKLATSNRVQSNRSSRSNSVTSLTNNARSSQTSLNQFGRWVTTNVGSIDEDFTAGSSSNISFGRKPSSHRNSSYGGIHFWEESPSSSSPMDALRKLSVSSTSSQQSGSGSGGSRTSLTSSQILTSPHSSSQSTVYRNTRPTLKSNESTLSLPAPGQRKIRLHIQGSTFLILVPADVRYDQLSSRVERKLKLCGKLPNANGTTASPPLILEYLDEDEDRVRLESDDDLLIAFESVPEQHELSIHVLV